MPTAAEFAVLANPNFPPAMNNAREAEAAGRRMGKDVIIFQAGSDTEIEAAFARIAQSGTRALMVAADPFFNSRRARIVALAAHYALPAMYEWHTPMHVRQARAGTRVDKGRRIRWTSKLHWPLRQESPWRSSM
jgi:hypothetical protein